MRIPNTYTDIDETGCCPVPNIDEWDTKEIEFKDQKFIRMYTRSFLHVPLNMGKVMKELQAKASRADALMPRKNGMILTREISAWKAEQLYAVSKQVKGAENITLSGTFITKVFEGPYQNAKKWYDILQEMADFNDRKVIDTYFFYTTCPKCAKHYGKNYTIGLAQVA